MSSVGKAVGGATSFLVGGKSIPRKQETNPISDVDQARQNEVGDNIQSLLSQQGADGNNYDDLFKQHLTDFLNSSNPNPTPEQTAQATNFVDQTFTQPMQNQLDQYNARFGDAENAKSAVLGRAPGSDQATQQAIYTSGLQNLYNLQAQRGANIQNTALGLNQQGFNRNAASSQFVNSLAQQALGNRMQLLNGLSGINEFNQRDRLSNITNSGGGTTSGLLTNVASIGKGMNDIQQQFWNRPMAQTGSGMMGMFTGGMGGGGLGDMAGGAGAAGGSFSNYGSNGASGFNLGGDGG